MRQDQTTLGLAPFQAVLWPCLWAVMWRKAFQIGGLDLLPMWTLSMIVMKRDDLVTSLQDWSARPTGKARIHQHHRQEDYVEI